MIPSPIHRVLSTIRKHRVQALLMGGQACVLYGAAEFSRDTDLAILADPENLAYLKSALDELAAVRIEAPPFGLEYLQRGHAVHFRRGLPDLQRPRVDVMSVMRGVDPFPDLFSRRTTLEVGDGAILDLLSVPDLVQAKKTQRDKDWPMIRRLVEVIYLQYRDAPNPARMGFWMRELRTPELILDMASRFAQAFAEVKGTRAVLEVAGDTFRYWEIEEVLRIEEVDERAADQAYWEPLKHEMEALRKLERLSPSTG